MHEEHHHFTVGGSKGKREEDLAVGGESGDHSKARTNPGVVSQEAHLLLTPSFPREVCHFDDAFIDIDDQAVLIPKSNHLFGVFLSQNDAPIGVDAILFDVELGIAQAESALKLGSNLPERYAHEPLSCELLLDYPGTGDVIL